MGESQPVLPAPRLELNWALLGSAGQLSCSGELEMPSVPLSIPHHGQTLSRTCLHAGTSHFRKSELVGGSSPGPDPLGCSIPELAVPSGACEGPQPRGSRAQGSVISPRSEEAGLRLIPPPSGAEHFKSRWCFKHVIRKKKNKTKNPQIEQRAETRGKSRRASKQPGSRAGCFVLILGCPELVPPRGGQHSPHPVPSTGSIPSRPRSSRRAGSPQGKPRMFPQDQ